MSLFKQLISYYDRFFKILYFWFMNWAIKYVREVSSPVSWFHDQTFTNIVRKLFVYKFAIKWLSRKINKTLLGSIVVISEFRYWYQMIVFNLQVTLTAIMGFQSCEVCPPNLAHKFENYVKNQFTVYKKIVISLLEMKKLITTAQEKNLLGGPRKVDPPKWWLLHPHAHPWTL